MTLTDVEQQTVAAQADFSSDGLIARAKEIAPTLVARQAETEQRNYYAEDTHRAFADAGFYRILVPKKYGGLGMGIDTFLKVSMAIARGCPSTGWMLTLGTSHALTVASFFPEEAQAELFAGDGFICPTTVKPQGRATRTPEDDGWIIDGDFNFASGAPYGTHYMGHTFFEGATGPMLFIAPRSEWSRLDDWGDQIGLKGSGSHSVRFEGGRIPDRFSMKDTGLMTLDVSGGTVGEKLHGSSLYAGSSYSFFMLEAAAVATGIAMGALDAYAELMETKQVPIPPFGLRKEDPDYQRWYGTAAGQIATAEAATLNCIDQWLQAAEDRAFTPETDMRLVTISKEAIRLNWLAISDVCARSSGSTSMRTGERIERIYRDMSTVHAHNGIVAFSEMATRMLAKAHFGVA